jgi:hypothetical protein
MTMGERSTTGPIGWPLSIMGTTMGRNVNRAGQSQVASDLVGSLLTSWWPREFHVAGRGDVFITMPPDSPDVGTVYLGVDGRAAGDRAARRGWLR